MLLKRGIDLKWGYRLLLGCLLAFGSLMVAPSVNAQGLEAVGPHGTALCFKSWKESQVLEAQNRVVRLSNRLVATRASRTNPENSGDNLNKTPESKSNPSEKELSAAIDHLQYSQELSLEDYFAIYLPQFRDDEAALGAIASKMTVDEVRALLRLSLKERTSFNESTINSKSSIFGTSEAGAARPTKL